MKYFAYINKDTGIPHQFETEAIQQYKKLLPEENSETENPKTAAWYEAQVQELLDIRIAFHNICGDTANGADAYFPDLVEKELKNMTEELSTSYKDIANLRIAIDKLKGLLSDANQDVYDLKLKSLIRKVLYEKILKQNI